MCIIKLRIINRNSLNNKLNNFNKHILANAKDANAHRELNPSVSLKNK